MRAKEVVYKLEVVYIRSYAHKIERLGGEIKNLTE